MNEQQNQRRAKTKPRRTTPPGKSGTAGQPDMVATVLERLINEIISGQFAPGTALPPEGELAKSHGVSRTVIREAMRGLRAHGLAEMSQGKPARVRPPDPKAVIASLEMLLRRNRASLLNLVEVRRPLESEIAALAAERSNDEHLRQLEHAIHELAAAPTLEQRIEADVKFHRILGEATGNPVFVLLLETLAGFLRESREQTLAYSGVEVALKGHRAVFEAIRLRDSDKARGAMLEHLCLATRDLHQLHSERLA
jgi:GntR family transcriptional repressor for pyruvate dehydrogenase complex